MLLDGAIIFVAATTFSWSFTLGPIATSLHAASLGGLIRATSPAMDLLLVAALLVLSARGDAFAPRREWIAAAGGLSALLVSDTVLQYEAIQNSQQFSGAGNVVGLIGYILLATSLVLALRSFSSRSVKTRSANSPAEASPPRPSHVWDSMLPYALVPASAFLAVRAWQAHSSDLSLLGSVIGALLLMGLASARQLLAIRENLKLYQRVDQAYRESLTYAQRMRALNEELQRTRDKLQMNFESLAGDNLRLQAQASTDPLTGLPNHKSMILALDRELERATRYGRACSVLFLDLDHFKAMNDSCGHLAGDTALRELTLPVMAALRNVDILGRWGGEEFLVIMPETEVADALSAAQRVCESVRSFNFSIAGGTRLTCSIGVATYPYDAGDRDELVESADRAMYAAKRLGRDQVRTAVDPSAVGFISELRRKGGREEASMWGVVEALTTILRVYDAGADDHLQNVSSLSMKLAMAVGLNASETRAVGLAARLHDIGKISVPQDVLQKDKGLTVEDWELVKGHPGIGAEVVTTIPSLVMLAPAIRSHHERWDGSGYPDGLSGNDIPIGGRIIAVADAYETMIQGRPYAPPRSVPGALQELERCAGKQFDPVITEYFCGMIRTEALAEKQAV